MGTQNRHNVPFSRVCIPKKRKIKAVERIKQIYKISKRVIKKIMPSGPESGDRPAF